MIIITGRKGNFEAAGESQGLYLKSTQAQTMMMMMMMMMIMMMNSLDVGSESHGLYLKSAPVKLHIECQTERNLEGVIHD